MKRASGQIITTTSYDETVRAFLPAPLPPVSPELDPTSFKELNEKAEKSLARLSGMSGLVSSSEWLVYSAIRKEALLTSQLEGTQATLTDIFDEEAGLAVTNVDDVEEVTNYLRAYKFVHDEMNSPSGLPVCVRLLKNAHEVLLSGARGAAKQPGEVRTTQNWMEERDRGMHLMFRRRQRKWGTCCLTSKSSFTPQTNFCRRLSELRSYMLSLKLFTPSLTVTGE